MPIVQKYIFRQSENNAGNVNIFYGGTREQNNWLCEHWDISIFDLIRPNAQILKEQRSDRDLAALRARIQSRRGA